MYSTVIIFSRFLVLLATNRVCGLPLPLSSFCCCCLLAAAEKRYPLPPIPLTWFFVPRYYSSRLDQVKFDRANVAERERGGGEDWIGWTLTQRQMQKKKKRLIEAERETGNTRNTTGWSSILYTINLNLKLKIACHASQPARERLEPTLFLFFSLSESLHLYQNVARVPGKRC